MRRVKNTMIGIVGAILLITVAFSTFLLFMGDDFYRWAIHSAVRGVVDREIRVNGTFSFDMGWEPSLFATDVTVANTPWAKSKYLATVKQVHIQVALRPLLSGIVRIPRLDFEGLDLDLETSVYGVDNWDILKTKPDDDIPETESTFTFLPINIVNLKSIDISHLDNRSAQKTTFVLDYLNNDFQESAAILKIEGSGNFNDRLFKLDGEIGSIELPLGTVEGFPVDVEFHSTNIEASLAGLVKDVRQEPQMDLVFTGHIPSIDNFFDSFHLDFPTTGEAHITAQLKGWLDGLTAEEVNLNITHSPERFFEAKGRIANLIEGEGLDMRFAGNLDADFINSSLPVPQKLETLARNLDTLVLSGRSVGNLDALGIQEGDILFAHKSGAKLRLTGSGDLDLSDQGQRVSSFDVKADLTMPDQKLLENLTDTSLPDLGTVRATADLAWAGKDVAMRSFSAQLSAMPKLDLQAHGVIGTLSPTDNFFELAPSLTVIASTPESRSFVEGLHWFLVEDSRNSKKRPAVSDINIVLGIQRELTIAGLDPGPIDGHMGAKTRRGIETYQEGQNLPVDGRATAELFAHIRSSNRFNQQQIETADTSPAFADVLISLRDIGPVSAKVQIAGKPDGYQLQDLEFSAGAKNSEYLGINGNLGLLRTEPDIGLNQIDLRAVVAIASSTKFAEFLPVDTPVLNNLIGELTARGSLKSMILSDIRITGEGEEGLRASLTGDETRVSLLDTFKIDKLSLQAHVNWPDVKGVSRLLDYELPELGAVRADAIVNRVGDKLKATSVVVTAGDEDKPVLKITGEIGDFAAFEQMQMTGNFRLPTKMLLEKNKVIEGADLGTVHGEFSVSDLDGSFGLETVNAAIDDTKLFKLKVSGKFDNIEQRDDLHLTTSLTVPDIARLSEVYDLDTNITGQFTFDGSVTGSDEKFHADGQALIGETELNGQISGTLAGERPKVVAKLTSPLFRLKDIGLTSYEGALDQEKTPDAQVKSTISDPNKIFSQELIPFEKLNEIDLDLDVLLEDVEGVHLDIDQVEARIIIEKGVLHVEPLQFNFVGGHLNGVLKVDTSVDPPFVSLNLLGDDVILGDFLSQSDVEVPLDGDLHLLADLRASGNTPHELASTLDGSFDMAVERGHVKTSLLRLSTTGPFTWMFSSSARKGYSELNCLITRFKIKEGRAESLTLLLDTPNSQVLGQGHVDLGDEVMDFQFSPSAKQRRLVSMSTPFSITGPMKDPTINVNSASVGMRMVGEVALSPLNLLGSLFTMWGSDVEDSSCLLSKENSSAE